MKKVFIAIFICMISAIFAGCSSGNMGKEDEITKRNRYNMVYMITRARQEGNENQINEYIPDIFLSKEFRERYIDKLLDIKDYTITSFGIREIKYELCNAKEKQDLCDELFERYSIKEEVSDEITNSGVLNYKIKYLNDKGEEKWLYSKNFTFKYKGDWTLLIIEEGEIE